MSDVALSRGAGRASIDSVGAIQWDELVRRSPHGSVFCESWFLDAAGVGRDLWCAELDGRRVGVMVLRGADGPVRSPGPFSMYQGVLLDQDWWALPEHSRVPAALRVVGSVLEELSRRYDRLSFCIHPDFWDLRAFSWFNYHRPSSERFTLDLHYTGWLDLSGRDFETYLAQIRKVRRYEYRRACAAGLLVEPSDDIETLLELYRQTFVRQGSEVAVDTEQELRSIAAAALSAGRGELLICRTADGAPASATLFLFDRHTGYYVVGANAPAYRNTGSGTFTLLEHIRRCIERGIDRVDVCGMNSPNRGDFKTSVGATLRPYHIASWGAWS